MLRTRLFKYFALLMVVFGVLSAVIGIRMIQRRVVAEAQTRVRLDLESAWAVYNARLRELEIILKLVAGKKDVVEAAINGDWTMDRLNERLDAIRRNFGLDYLGIVSADGRVALRAAPPHRWDDHPEGFDSIASALRGHTMVCTELVTPEQLEREAGGLAARATIRVEPTPYARVDDKTIEERGLVLSGAAPIQKDDRLLGAVYGGILLNRNEGLVDNIVRVVFHGDAMRDLPEGTATIFLDDCRIATTVLSSDGTRAVGTRVSHEVADRVLDLGESWVGRAYVVRDWFLTAYSPIRDGRQRIIGMLYVGIPEAPFRAMERSLALRYALLLVFGLLFSLWLAFFLAHRLSRPIHRLSNAAQRMERGEAPCPVEPDGVCEETDLLTRQFNGMADALAGREARLKTANEQLEKANTALRALNQSYMNVVGFVSHELQSPVATIMNYLYALRQCTLGPLTPEQARVLEHIERQSHDIVNMVRHYLNLSRIETGEWVPAPIRVALREDVVQPLLEARAQEILNRGVHIANRVAPEVVALADPHMIREIFENLLGNAIKYGRDGGNVDVTAHPDGDRIVCAVRNDGPPIPTDKADRLFRKFSRIDPPRGARRTKGTGLGLFITRHMVEAHGGTIEALTTPDGWTEFRFSLPRALG